MLGAQKEYPTRRLAERALDQRLTEAGLNSLNYKPRPTANSGEFAMKWQKEDTPRALKHGKIYTKQAWQELTDLNAMQSLLFL